MVSSAGELPSKSGITDSMWSGPFGIPDGMQDLTRFRSLNLGGTMKASQGVVRCALLCAAGLMLPSWTAFSQAARPQAVTAARDGQHDFDFELGSWKIH